MLKKWKILVPVGLAILLAATVFVVPVMADDDDEIEEPSGIGSLKGPFGWGSGDFLSKIAENLGIGEDELKNAISDVSGELFQERAKLREDCLELDPELRQERRQEAVDQLVEDGVITADEAEEIREWWSARPEACDKVFQGRGLLGGDRGFSRGFCPRRLPELETD